MTWFKRKKENQDETVQNQATEPTDPEGQYRLGIQYLEGDGVKKSEKKAADLFQKAADKGHVEAMKKLAWCYLYGRGVKQNLSEGLKISQMAEGTDFKVDMNKFGALIRK